MAKQEMKWFEHLGAACEGFISEMKGSVPEGFKTHSKASCREMLLALRSLLDGAIERTEEPKPKKARKVEVH